MQRTLPLSLAVMIIVASCSGNKAYQTSEHSAMSSFNVPLYENAAAVTSGTIMKNLKAGTLVYSTPDTIHVNENKFVRVVWGDSSAYAPINRLLPQGRLATVTADSQSGEVMVYKDPQLRESAFEFPFDWMMVVVGNPTGAATPIMYKNVDTEDMQVGYIANSYVSLDPLGIEFFKKYYEAVGKSKELGSNTPLEELRADPKYQGLTPWAWRFSEDYDYSNASAGGDVNEYGEGDGPYGEGDLYGEAGGPFGEFDQEAYDRFTSPVDWIGADGETPLTESEIPGTMKKYFVLETGAVIDAKGLWLLNLYPDGEKVPDDAAGKTVTEVRFEFTATSDVSINMEIEVWDSDLNYTRAIRNEQFEAQAGKSYTVTATNEPGAAALCSAMRMTASTATATTSLVVSAECGD